MLNVKANLVINQRKIKGNCMDLPGLLALIIVCFVHFLCFIMFLHFQVLMN